MLAHPFITKHATNVSEIQESFFFILPINARAINGDISQKKNLIKQIIIFNMFLRLVLKLAETHAVKMNQKYFVIKV